MYEAYRDTGMHYVDFSKYRFLFNQTWKLVLQIKKQNDNLQTRNMELVKANTDLRHKQGDSENMIQNLKDKVSEQKKRIEYLNRSKKEMEENSERMKVKRTCISCVDASVYSVYVDTLKIRFSLYTPVIE